MGQLERSRNQNSQLVLSEKALMEMVESHRSRAETKEQSYLDLQKKLNQVQSSLEGDHDKEAILMEQLTQLEADSRSMESKCQVELSRAEEMAREHEILKAKLSSTSEMTLLKSRRLREQMDEQLAMENKFSKENTRIRAELSSVISESSKNEQMYLALKKMYDEEKAGTQIEDQRKIEQELESRILILEKEEAEKNLRLKKAREFEEQRRFEITSSSQRLTLTLEQITQINLEIQRLQQELSVVGSGAV